MVQQLYLEDLKVGDKWISGEASLSEAEIKDFAKDYDPQPYHLDNERARDTFFGTLVASGWQTAGVTMRLMVQTIPIATGLIGAGAQISWPAPTYPNDILHIEAEVVDIKASKSKPDRGMVVVQINTFNQNQQIVQRFTCTMLAFKRTAGIPSLNNEHLLGSQV